MIFVETLIVGTGFSGIGMAVNLKKANMNNFLVLEKGSDIGGAWRENTYPGCACDVQSHLYSFSFAPNPNWTRMFAPQQEIKNYLKDTAKKYNVLSHIKFNHPMHEAVYNKESGRWIVKCGDDQVISAKIIVSGIGGLHIPNIPNIKGAEKFKGKIFHSANWDHDYNLKGKRVAVLGTGASAIQFVPAIADSVKHLTLFQRSAPWVLPKPDRKITKLEHALFKIYPSIQRAMRHSIYWQLETRALAMVIEPKILKSLEPYFKLHLKRQVKDKALRKKLTPNFNLGCKRILISNNYYPSLAQNHVDVVTDGIKEITAKGVVTHDGTLHEVDAIIYGTGFKAGESYSAINIIGKDGVKLEQAWSDGEKAYAGVSVSGFPNFYMLMGPNTGLSHNSFVYMIESQVQYIKDAITKSKKYSWKSVEVKPYVQSSHVDNVQAKSDSAVWAEGCTSWYLDDKGKNWLLWPGFTFNYRWKLRQFKPENYIIEPGTASEA